MYPQSYQIAQQQRERSRPMFGFVAGLLAAVLLGATVAAFGGTV